MTTPAGLLLRLACGQPVTAREALQCLVEADPALVKIRHRTQRDQALAAAAVALGWSGAAGTWTTAGKLAKAVQRFETVHWPRIRAGQPLTTLAPVDQHLAQAFLLGQVPASARGLFDVLRNQRPEIAGKAREH